MSTTKLVVTVVVANFVTAAIAGALKKALEDLPKKTD